MTDYLRTKEAAALLGLRVDTTTHTLRRAGVEPVPMGKGNHLAWPVEQVRAVAEKRQHQAQLAASDATVTTAEAAEILGVRPDTAPRILQRERVKPRGKMGRAYAWSVRDVEAAAARYKKAKGGKAAAANGSISIDGRRRARPTFDHGTHEAKCRAAYAALVERLTEHDLDESVLELAQWAPEFERVVD